MKKRMLSLAASTLLVSSAMAAANIATDGTGDYLVAPMYTFGNGYDTKLVLMNTDNEHAYLVRGVVRSGVDSHEIKDFTIMLSPGDVWDATIADNEIISNDDSNWNVPLNEGLNGIETGYVEFYVLAELNNDNPVVASALHHSNYSDAYKLVTTDVNSIDKLGLLGLKKLFINALGGENAATRDPNAVDLSYVLDHTQINNDAIGGYVTISSTINGTLHTTLPLFAFEHTRETGSNLDAFGMAPGEPSNINAYVGEQGKTDILNLVRYNYVSIPYSLEESDAKLNFTFIQDYNNIDEGLTGKVQDRSFKQNFRNMSEKYPVETMSCLEGQELIDYVTATFEDAKNPNISIYNPPKCEIKAGYSLTLGNEVDAVVVSQALAFEANKKYTRVITYWTKDEAYKTVEETLSWNDVNVSEYTSGMYQVHDIQNIYDLEDGIQFDDGQTRYGQTLQAGYIPTYFDIKILDGKPFLNWNYAITNK